MDYNDSDFTEEVRLAPVSQNAWENALRLAQQIIDWYDFQRKKGKLPPRRISTQESELSKIQSHANMKLELDILNCPCTECPKVETCKQECFEFQVYLDPRKK